MRVLIVEDEALVALDLAESVRGMGHEVAGPFGTGAEARPMCRAGSIDFAVMDFNLKGETTEALADALRAEDVPFVVVTGFRRDGLPAGFRDAPILAKPLQPGSLKAAIAEAGRRVK